jgi:ubiquinone/menaquinone biosynthesis C-methylase UbiE
MAFRDLFSARADEYARRRPRYPAALFEYLASVTVSHERAWDCATGNGQAALGLAPYFDEVVATDASQGQLENAVQHPNVIYRQARAEESGLESGSMDIVTVAQAVHWFDVEAFFAEAQRVLKPGGVCAVWTYALTQVSPEVDKIISDFYHNVVGPYWPREFAIVNDGYRSLAFPFEELEHPDLTIELEWTMHDLLAFVATWSPVRRYIEANGDDPIELIREAMGEAWGDPDKPKRVVWPIRMRVGRRT